MTIPPHPTFTQGIPAVLYMHTPMRVWGLYDKNCEALAESTGPNLAHGVARLCCIHATHGPAAGQSSSTMRDMALLQNNPTHAAFRLAAVAGVGRQDNQRQYCTKHGTCSAHASTLRSPKYCRSTISCYCLSTAECPLSKAQKVGKTRSFWRYSCMA